MREITVVDDLLYLNCLLSLLNMVEGITLYILRLDFNFIVFFCEFYLSRSLLTKSNLNLYLNYQIY